ncbi:MAG: hypothetical protein IKK75_13715, partial [Clostridia bacterium]|nr:hypothetical protein [Clostridia bacterium]
MSTSLFTLSAELDLDASKFVAGLNEANAGGNQLFDNLTSLSRKAVDLGKSLYNIGGDVFNVGKALAMTAAEIQAEEAAFASTFKFQAEEADAILKKIGESTGIYANRMKDSATRMFSQFVAGGNNSATAMNMMERSLMLAADGAAFWDISLEDASERLRSFLRGNLEAGEAIGLFVTQTDRERLAIGMFNKEWKDLTEGQRQMALLAQAESIYTTTRMAGQAARESSSLLNQMGNIGRKWEEVQAKLGAPIIDAVIPVLEEFSAFLTDNPELVDSFAAAIGSLAGALSDLAISGIQFVGSNSDSVTGFVNWITDTALPFFGIKGANPTP